MGFEERVFAFIGKHQLIRPRGLLMVGVSGGADSMALLLALCALRHRLGIRLHAAHFNHRLRRAAVSDARFVAQWCRRLQVPLTVGERPGQGLLRISEDKARQMRFDFFARSARALKAQAVALAHTQNDLAETVLLRMVRGSGLYGLKAIVPKRVIKETVFVRPLLDFHRGEIEAYLKAQKVPYRRDATNRLPQYLRNQVRLQLLPLLIKAYNPQMVRVLGDLARTAGDDYDYLESAARKHFEKNVIISDRRVKIALKRLRGLHPSLLRIILRMMAQQQKQDLIQLSCAHVQALEQGLAQKAKGIVHLPQGLKARKVKDYFEIYGA